MGGLKKPNSVERLVTQETDITKVLKPDGTGGLILDFVTATLQGFQAFYIGGDYGDDVDGRGTPTKPWATRQKAIDYALANTIPKFQIIADPTTAYEANVHVYAEQEVILRGSTPIFGVTGVKDIGEILMDTPDFGNPTRLFLDDIFVDTFKEGPTNIDIGEVIIEESFVNDLYNNAETGPPTLTKFYTSQMRGNVATTIVGLKGAQGWIGSAIDEFGRLYGSSGFDANDHTLKNLADPLHYKDAMTAASHDADFHPTTGHDHDGANSKKVTAGDVKIVDAGGQYVSDNVEGALQEITAGEYAVAVFTFNDKNPNQKTYFMGNNSNAYAPPIDIRLRELKMQVEATTGNCDFRVVVYKYDAGTATNIPILDLQGLNLAAGWHNLTDNTPDETEWDLDVSAGDRVFVLLSNIAQSGSPASTKNVSIQVHYERV